MNQEIEKVKTPLEIDEDIDLHVKGWIVQRIGWLLMLAFLLASVLGLFGTGLLSRVTSKKNENALVFERFNRYDNEVELAIESKSVNGMIELRLPKEYMEVFRLESIVPEPQENTILNGYYLYRFSASDAALITLSVTPKKIGYYGMTLSINDTDFQIRTLIYP